MRSGIRARGRRYLFARIKQGEKPPDRPPRLYRRARSAIFLSLLALLVILQCLVAQGAMAWRFVG